MHSSRARTRSFLASRTIENTRITGTIPATLVQLNDLETLNLQNNDLTGTIPSEFVDFDKLSSIQLQNNQLTGELPSDWCTTPPQLLQAHGALSQRKQRSQRTKRMQKFRH